MVRMRGERQILTTAILTGIFLVTTAILGGVFWGTTAISRGCSGALQHL